MKELERDRKLFGGDEGSKHPTDIVDSSPNVVVLPVNSSVPSELEGAALIPRVKVEKVESVLSINVESSTDNTSADPDQDSIDSDLSFGNYITRYKLDF